MLLLPMIKAVNLSGRQMQISPEYLGVASKKSRKASKKISDVYSYLYGFSGLPTAHSGPLGVG